MSDLGPKRFLYIVGTSYTGSTLLSFGTIRCADCGEQACVAEESLGRLTLEVLGSW